MAVGDRLVLAQLEPEQSITAALEAVPDRVRLMALLSALEPRLALIGLLRRVQAETPDWLLRLAPQFWSQSYPMTGAPA